MAYIRFEQCAIEDTAKTAATGKLCYADGIEATIQVDAKSSLIYRLPAPHTDESMDAYRERVAVVAPIIAQEQDDGGRRFSWFDSLRSYIEGKVFCSGTPLESMTWLSRGQVETLRSAGIDSVENLAKVGHGQLEPFGLDGRDLSQKARAWLDDQSGLAVAKIQQQGEELAAMAEEREQMRETLKAMQARIAQLEGEQQPKKRGRRTADPVSVEDGDNA